MNNPTAARPSGGRKFARVLGRYTSGSPGPTLLVCGGLHGNEPSGPMAAERVMAALEELKPEIAGEILAVAGNLEALAQDRRYTDFDLNRCWSRAAVARLQAQDPGRDSPGEREQRALMEIIDAATERSQGHVSLLDLHTTSGDSPPFVLISDTLRNRKLAFAIPAPIILGLEETVDGTLLGYLEERGHRALVVETGQHRNPGSVDRHEAVIWLTMVAAGLLDAAAVLDFEAHRRTIEAACRGLPRIVEISHRHGLSAGSGFVMAPGFASFREVRQGEVLGRDRSGEVSAPMSGRLLMPLYQDQGDDGFFMVRRVRRFWIVLSAVLRRLRVGVVLPLLPGVRRHPDRPGALLVNPKVARLFPVQVFHLFGYRRRRADGEQLVFTRRRQIT